MYQYLIVKGEDDKCSTNLRNIDDENDDDYDTFDWELEQKMALSFEVSHYNNVR